MTANMSSASHRASERRTAPVNEAVLLDPNTHAHTLAYSHTRTHAHSGELPLTTADHH